ncbi:MAG: hypothetical protein WBD04_00420 [Candidatus Omnitrophota bacterium]
MKKFLVYFLVVLLAVSGVLFLFRATVAKMAVNYAIEGMVGAPVKVGKLSLDLPNNTVNMTDFKIFNPKGFPKDVLMDISSLKLVFNKITPLRQKDMVITFMDIELKEVMVIKNKEGKLNADALKFVPPKGEEKEAKAVPTHMPVELMELSMGRVVYKDYTVKGAPSVSVFDVNMKDKKYKKMPGVEVVLAIILREALTKAAIQNAAVYGVTAVSGVGFWPATAAIIVVGNDSAGMEFKNPPDEVYNAAVKTLETIGKVAAKDPKKRIIKAASKGNSVEVKILSKDEQTSKVIVSSRKLLYPMPDFAKSVLYQISENIPKKD